jgi:dethiobiotin synthetase
VETGCNPEPADATALAHAAHDDRPLSEICPLQLRTPISPHAAAHLEGRTIDPDALVRAVPTDADLLLVEGAGGLLSPLDDDLVMADLAARLSLPLLIVINHSLGAINRSMLTVEVARARHLPIAALVLNPTTDTPAPDHAADIARFTRTRLLGPLPYGDRLGGSSMLESLFV